jgi:hypothetical protein
VSITPASKWPTTRHFDIQYCRFSLANSLTS